jgi:hypothetical protein
LICCRASRYVAATVTLLAGDDFADWVHAFKARRIHGAVGRSMLM